LMSIHEIMVSKCRARPFLMTGFMQG